jgi:hypothetical protein
VIGLGVCPVLRNTRPYSTKASTYELGHKIIFSRPANSVFYATGGWGEENEIGRNWDSASKKLRVTLELKDTTPARMKLNVLFGKQYSSCLLRTTINGIHIHTSGDPCSNGKNSLAMDIPAGVIGPDGYVDIVFERDELGDHSMNTYIVSELTLSSL